MEKEILITCECKGEVLSLSRFVDEVYLSVYKYYSVSNSFSSRISMCFDVLRGKGINTGDVVLSKENFEKLKQF